jgi:hypothetical protein
MSLPFPLAAFSQRIEFRWRIKIEPHPAVKIRTLRFETPGSARECDGCSRFVGDGKSAKSVSHKNCLLPFQAIRAMILCSAQFAFLGSGWLPRPMRRSSESYNDVTLRLASERQALKGSPLSTLRPSAVSTTSLQRRLSSGVKTDAEGFICPSYNATGGASKAMRRGNFHCWDTNETLAVRLNRNTLKHQIIYMQSTPCHGPMNGQGCATERVFRRQAPNGSVRP